ncbi:MAG: MFS transporter [Gammaproteobacteria bacterium]|nr:MFS transporter [Gammaproteobacteria bacterium]MYD02272.1 MFS transporter [Gammaproteobacteria bacterium]MYI24736.1 MFS transporter [Gammaproteobacteria bacterium]
MVVLLTIVYIFSFIDRFILGLLIQPIQADLGLTDTQIGLLLGPAFAIFYVLMGLPFGWLADRKRRTFIVAAGLAIWSAATAVSGLARSFLGLFIARMSVGVGEASLSPCAMSLMADCFPKEKRGKPIAFYSMAISLGAGIAALTGAAVIAWATQSDYVSVPGLGDLAPWRVSLLVVGLPGLLLVPLVLLLREPERTVDTVTSNAQGIGYRAVFSYIRGRPAGLFGVVWVFGYVILIGFSSSWGAAAFARTWGWSPVQYGQAIGILFIALGPLAVNLGGWMSDRLLQKGRTAAPLLVGLYGVPVMTIAGVIWPLMPSAGLGLVFLGAMLAAVALSTATGVTALLNIIPSNIRGQSVAIYYMATALLGQGLGPLCIGLMNDHVFGYDNLRYSMASLPVIFGIPLFLAVPWILKKYRQSFEELNGPQS